MRISQMHVISGETHKMTITLPAAVKPGDVVSVDVLSAGGFAGERIGTVWLSIEEVEEA